MNMKECYNSTRKIHISSNFILSIRFLIMFDTLLLRPSLHCNTSSHLHFTTLSFSFTHLHFLSFYTSLYISYRSIIITPIFKDIPFCMTGIIPAVLFRGREIDLYLTSFAPTINVSGCRQPVGSRGGTAGHLQLITMAHASLE
jgi:hypothetical protein